MSAGAAKEMTAGHPRSESTVGHWINGKSEVAAFGRSGEVFNPATGEIIARAGFAGIEDVDRAVAAAKAAFGQWRSTPLSRRAEIMFQLRELVVRIAGGSPS